MFSNQGPCWLIGSLKFLAMFKIVALVTHDVVSHSIVFFVTSSCRVSTSKNYTIDNTIIKFRFLIVDYSITKTITLIIVQISNWFK